MEFHTAPPAPANDFPDPSFPHQDQGAGKPLPTCQIAARWFSTDDAAEMANIAIARILTSDIFHHRSSMNRLPSDRRTHQPARKNGCSSIDHVLIRPARSCRYMERMVSFINDMKSGP